MNLVLKNYHSVRLVLVIFSIHAANLDVVPGCQPLYVYGSGQPLYRDPSTRSLWEPQQYHVDWDPYAGMSLKEPRNKAAATAVERSRSFAGMTSRPLSIGSIPVPGQAPVLGDTIRHSAKGYTMKGAQSPHGNLGVSFKKSPKIPKVPRPKRAFLMFDSVKVGLREFIDATKEDIEQLKMRNLDSSSQSQGKIHETDKQIRAAERYLKRLEFHLSKIDELHEHYLVKQQLQEGIRTMHQAYVTSPGRQKDTLTSVKYGYKECSQMMCAIEAQLENMLGTFHCRLKGMAGFARMCPGDVFEISIRHGSQKWKAKGRVEKTGAQKWDNAEFTFKALVGDIMNIKGVELRSFKTVLLGQKNCDTKDLYTANPQLMTVNINANGSLKLSIVVTWNPLDGMDENASYFEIPSQSQGTPRRRPVSVLALNGELRGSHSDLSEEKRRLHSPVSLQQTKDDNFILRTSNPHNPHINTTDSLQYHSEAVLRHNDSGRTPHRDTVHMFHGGGMYLPSRSSSPPPLPPRYSQVFPNSDTLPLPAYTHLHFPVALSHSSSPTKDDPTSVEDALSNLNTALEDFHGQYTEIQKLEIVLVSLERLLKKHSRCSSRSSSISISIESALGAFDFLNKEEVIEDIDNQEGAFDMLSSPESTAKTADSGIESLARRLSEDARLESVGSSPVPPSTGNEQVDQALLFHLIYCEKLLESLGNFGPLKCREIYALDRLKKQADMIESLIKIAKAGSEVDIQSVLAELTKDKAVANLWTRCAEHTALFIHPEKLVSVLDDMFGSQILEKFVIDPKRVFRNTVTRVLDVSSSYDQGTLRSSCWITVHQLVSWLKEEGGLSVLQSIATELQLIDRFCSGNADIVIKSILKLRDSIPQSPCLKVMGVLLVGTNKEVEQCAASYLNLIQKKTELRDKAMVVFAEGLEDQSADIRAGACVALSILEVRECIDRLVFVYQSDDSTVVRQCSKEALFKLGEEGRKAYEDAQLSTHGFQGVHMKK
ncbi:hypothetical protein ScPMuIL_015139 [Solemya velum]